MRNKATDALLSIGIPMNQPGFLYMVDILELFEENGAPITNMGAVYNMVAKARRCCPKEVTESISYSIKYAFANGKVANRTKYFGLGITPKSNGNYLAMMWQRLKEEE